jgi:PEGA domain
MMASRHSRGTRVSAVALTLAILTEAVPSLAQTGAPSASSPADEAAALKRAGNEALGALRPADALEAYKKAYALSPEPALHYNMGHALEALADYPGALAEYEEFARVAPPDLKARVPKLAELIAEIRGRVTRVGFHCNVAGARVLVRDIAVGTIGPDGTFSRAFPAGPASFEVAADGYAPYKQQTTFVPGGEVSLDIALVTKSKAGVLRVTSVPEGGDVYVDDKSAGQSPTEMSVVAGTHRIVVRKAGLREATTQAVVDVGETKEVSVDLEKKPGIYTQWWFWTSIAFVAAGATVVTYAAFKSRSPDTGSLGTVTPQSLSIANW